MADLKKNDKTKWKGKRTERADVQLYKKGRNVEAAVEVEQRLIVIAIAHNANVSLWQWNPLSAASLCAAATSGAGPQASSATL